MCHGPSRSTPRFHFSNSNPGTCGAVNLAGPRASNLCKSTRADSSAFSFASRSFSHRAAVVFANSAGSTSKSTARKFARASVLETSCNPRCASSRASHRFVSRANTMPLARSRSGRRDVSNNRSPLVSNVSGTNVHCSSSSANPSASAFWRSFASVTALTRARWCNESRCVWSANFFSFSSPTLFLASRPDSSLSLFLENSLKDPGSVKWKGLTCVTLGFGGVFGGFTRGSAAPSALGGNLPSGNPSNETGGC